MDFNKHAQDLLEDFNRCIQAQPKHNAVDIQLEKDAVGKWAVNLNNLMAWGTENEIAEACYQLEPRLKKLKEKLVIEILQNGSV